VDREITLTPIVVTLRTERLLLRPWRESDRAPFAALNADPKVMEHFPALSTRAESDAGFDRIVARMETQGFGFWAIEVPGVTEFIGFIGLGPADAVLGRPVLEIGWRLAAEHWGRGYATEGGRASLAHAFDALGEDEVVSFTTAGNQRSRRVMEKLGMIRRPEDDFDHPGVPLSWSGRRHVLYRITVEQWRSQVAARAAAVRGTARHGRRSSTASRNTLSAQAHRL
jgi:RimJ/RimL family protein N-acetyltransferase